MTKRDNSVKVLYMDGNDVCFGRVRFFLLVTVHDKTTVLALTEKLESLHYSENLHVLKVQKTDEFHYIPIKTIKEGCMFLEVQSNHDITCYVCRFPDKLESD